MKYFYLFLFTSFLVFASQTSAQNFIKNPGFETWNGNQPASWVGSTLTKSTVTHSGSSALKLSNTTLFTIPFMGSVSQDSIPVSGSSFTLKGWYQFYPDSGDQVSIFVWIYGPQGVIGRLEGANVLTISQKTSVYTAFALGVTMLPGANGDTASINIMTGPDSVSGNWHLGTYALFDDFVLDNTVTGVKENEFAMPSTFSLAQNYPNPFNPTTEIEFTIPSGCHVTLKVYNIMGQEVASLVDNYLERGRYKESFDGSRLASGIYLYKIQAGNFFQIKKMLLLK